MGIAIDAGTDVAIETDPFDVIGVITLSRATLRKMHQNLWWAAGSNTIAFPSAAGLFYPAFGLILRPEIAAISMLGSSLLVAVNALMLKNTKLEGNRAKAYALAEGSSGGLNSRFIALEVIQIIYRRCDTSEQE